MEQIYNIYKITNILNNKIYVGQTSKTIKERLTAHFHSAFDVKLNTRFYRAIRKYGKSAFIIELLDTAFNKESCNEKEKMWIKRLNSANRDIGYNSCEGGEGGNTFMFKTEEEMAEISKKISEKLRGDNNGNASPLKCKNIETNEVIHFKSGTSCQEYFQSIGNPIKYKEYFRHCKANRKYHIQPLFNNKYMFAYENDDFFDYSFYHLKHGKYPLMIINKDTNESFVGLNLDECKAKANASHLSRKVFYKKYKTQRINYLENE